MSANHHAKILKAVRERLAEHGVPKDEAIVAALDRFKAERDDSIKRAAQYEERMLRAEAERDLACKTRDGAQASANKSLAKERATTWENAALRQFLEMVLWHMGDKFRQSGEEKLGDIYRGAKAMADKAGVKRSEDELYEAQGGSMRFWGPPRTTP